MPTLLHWDSRLSHGEELRPSRRLVREALYVQKQTVLSAWGIEEDVMDYTVAGNFDWAFCTPVHGDACRGWGLYVTGKLQGDATSTILAPWETNEIGADLKFAELVAEILGSLRQVQRLQTQQASLRHFFSPAVLQTLFRASETHPNGSDPTRVLQPRETQVTVLFCDLRGFSREAEKHADALIALLTRVSKALGVMTQNILDNGGVIGDFQGDAAMGFWGWPLPQPDKVRRACTAALGIRKRFETAAQYKEHPLHGFRVGVGLATGTAVAGPIGSLHQVKVTVFGPVVNLAARLEGMTKALQAPILADEATAALILREVDNQAVRCRRLARVTPAGMDKPLTVTELLPPYEEYPVLTDGHLRSYEQALDEFLAGNWTRAFELLHEVPAQDRGKLFLTRYMIGKNLTPPPEWDQDNSIHMDSKS